MNTSLIYRDRGLIKFWLILCLLLVAAMVMLGGYTRLSGAGLSIIEWKPVHGVIPPLSDTDWWVEFEGYKASPQYQKINRGMSVDEFKAIFWPEYFHRLLGRTVGLVVLLPLLIFAARKSISRRFGLRMIGIFALGGLQGLIGWLMVKSGLINDPHVSHLRLTLHLSIAFAIFGWLEWTLLTVMPAQAGIRSDSKKWYLIWFFFLATQIVFGAMVAGLKAGMIYNTWPLMNGQLTPDELLFVSPWYENLVLIQFIHRWLAVLVALGFPLWWYLNRAYVSHKACLSVMLAIALQFLLGVLTLIHEVPLPLALLHQAVALVLFAGAVNLLHKNYGH